jgi:hypothetical protein
MKPSMPTQYSAKCPRVASRSATRRFQLPSKPELPLLIHATMGPRGSAWSKPATSTARTPLVFAHVYWIFCTGCSLALTVLLLHCEGLSCTTPPLLAFLFLLSSCFQYFSRVPLQCPRIFLSCPSSSHLSLILRYSQTNAMRSTWASRQSWIRSRTNALST